MAVATGSSASVPMGSFRRTRQATPSAYSPDRPSLHRCERNSPVKNRKRETRASGSVRGEDGNVLTYSAHGDKGTLSNWRSPPRPGAKSSEEGRSYNRLNREVDRRREGGGRVRSSEEAE